MGVYHGVLVSVLLCAIAGSHAARVLHQGGVAEEEEPGGGAAFLSDVLPLNIAITTPGQLLDGSSPLTVNGKQAITVVYSRSVIALGEDFGTTFLPDERVPFSLEPEIPGRFRWVTTYIARWDPVGSWPPDTEVTLKWNKGLKTHDGISMDADEFPEDFRLRTPGLSMGIEWVESEKASNLTDGAWSPYNSVTSSFPEVPPDGVIRLEFDYDVSLSILAENLKIEKDGKPVDDIKPIVKPCKHRNEDDIPEEDDCALVTIDGELEPATRYDIVLEKGTKYNSKAGPLRSTLKDGFDGLQEFRVPLVDTSVGTRFLTMNLPHGLDDSIPEETILENLKEQIQITDNNEEIEFEIVRVNQGTVRVDARLLPSRIYKFEILASENIKDGFGLPLLGSSCRIKTYDIDEEFSVLSSDYEFAYFEADQDWGRKTASLSKGITPALQSTEFKECFDVDNGVVNAFEIEGINDVLSTLAINAQGSSQRSASRAFGKPDVSHTHTSHHDFGEVHEYNLTDLLDGSGILAYEACEWNVDKHFIIETDIQAVVLRTKHGESVVWLTSTSTGDPVEGAKVLIYRNSKARWQYKLRDPEDFVLFAEGETDSDGKAAFDGLVSNHLSLVVQHKNRSIVLPSIDASYSPYNAPVKGSLILDRALVKPGESMHVSGYIMSEKTGEAGWQPSGQTKAQLSIRPPLDPESNDWLEIHEISVSKEFGSFEYTIPIKEGTPFKQYRVELQESDTYGVYFTVGDPRPPTVSLTINSPLWAKPNALVPIEIIAESFIGSSVGDAEVTLDWVIQDGEMNFERGNETVIITDSDGKGAYNIDLGQFEVPITPGSTLALHASWVGPTRELIEESTEVMLEVADVSMNIAKTVDTDMPLRMFGVAVEVKDLSGAPLDIEDVNVELKKATSEDLDDYYYGSVQTSATEPLDSEPLDSCTLVANSNDYSCRFSLPDFGRYALEACIVVDEATVCQRSFFGRPLMNWEEDSPVSYHLDMELFELSSGPYAVGDVARFAIDNPYRNAKAILMWGSQIGSQYKIEALEDESLAELNVEVDENCILDCGFIVAISIPRQQQGLVVDTKIPVSKIFDLAMPHVDYHSRTIEVIQDTHLDVDFSFSDVEEDGDDVVIAPGETTEIEIEVDPEVADKAEVLVVVVDKSILELQPYPLQDVSSEFKQSWEESYGFSSTSDYFVAPHAIDALIEEFNKRKAMNPWFIPDNQLSAGYHRALDLTDEEYAQENSESISGSSYGGGGGYYADTFEDGYGYAYAASESLEVSARSGTASAASISLASSGSAPRAMIASKSAASFVGDEAESDAAPLTSSVRIQKDFVSTVMFETVLAEGGVARVNFTAPDSLSTFVVRTYATSGAGQFGSSEKEIIVRRKVSLTPTAPRFARVGDVFEAGAVVTVSGSEKDGVPVSVRLSLPEDSAINLVLLDEAERTVEMGADGTAEVRFKLKAVKMGEANFEISADDEQGGSDALLLTVPVEGLQEQVAIASSFAIDGSGMLGWQEGLKLPEAVPGSGSLIIQAGVGRLPAVLSLADQIHDAFSRYPCPWSFDDALGLAFTPFITESYDVMSLDMASLDNTTHGILKNIIPGFRKGVAALDEMTTPALGLRHSLPCNSGGQSEPKKPSLYVNAQALWAFNELEKDLRGSNLKGIEESSSDLAVAALYWEDAVESTVIEMAENRRDDFNRSISLSTVALARSALGGDFEFTGVSKDVSDDLSMERLSREFNILGMQDQARYILARLGMKGGGDHPDVKKAIASWSSKLRVPGRTAYIAYNKTAAQPESNIANSMALMVMVRAKEQNALAEKLANYIGSPPVGDYGFGSFRSYDKLISMIALRDYDMAKSSSQLDLDLEVRSGMVEILTASFRESTNPVASASAPWESLDSPPKPLEFLAIGKGEVTLAASLTFIPAKLLPFPTYRGIYLQRLVHVKDVESLSLKTVPVTSIITISVYLTTPDTLGATTIRVLMPAGLEPIDPNLSDSAVLCPLASFGMSYFSCPDQETRPSVVTFSFLSLPAGVHTISLDAFAATAGEFTLPPVRAFVDEQPEVMGMSAPGKMVVCSGDDCHAEEDKPPKIPKACPRDCSQNGACNLDSGTCLCLPGFLGEDCSQLGKL